jgi:hypothetical protein
MDSVLVVATGAGVALVALSYLLLRRLTQAGIEPSDIQRIENFCIANYAPITRLLQDDDLEFLRTQPGYEVGLDRRLRAERVATLRGYLRALGKDFSSLHRAARTLAAHAPDDQPEFARELLVQGLTFWAGMVSVHIQVALYAWNLRSTVERLENLVDTVESLRQQMFALEPADLRG